MSDTSRPGSETVSDKDRLDTYVDLPVLDNGRKGNRNYLNSIRKR